MPSRTFFGRQNNENRSEHDGTIIKERLILKLTTCEQLIDSHMSLIDGLQTRENRLVTPMSFNLSEPRSSGAFVSDNNEGST